MFERGQKYDRDQVREYLGSGHTQAGVMWSTQRPLKRPNEVVITSGGRHAKKAGYKDRRHSSGSWIYYGQGREGDQNLDSAANKKIRDQNNVLLLFHTKEPTAAEAQAAGNHRKSYEFVGSFRCREWGTKKIHTGKRVGDILVRFYLEPSLWKERSTGTIKPIQKRDACVITTQVDDLIVFESVCLIYLYFFDYISDNYSIINRLETFDSGTEIRQDVFDNPGEAQARAKEIGCSGIHTHDENGKTIFISIVRAQRKVLIFIYIKKVIFIRIFL